MYTFACVLLVSVVTTLGMPQYVEPPEIEGHLDDAYQFAYAVASPEHGDYHGHQQSRDERGFTSGSYYLLGADGQWSQTIFADKGAGYQAIYNQRPAGAPPPQVSEVTYQVFVHPGATAISAQGGGAPAPPPVPASLGPFGGIQQKSLQGNQAQVRQQQHQQQRQQQQQFNNAQRFNREIQGSGSLIPQPVQQTPRFNRDIEVLNVSPGKEQTKSRQAIPEQYVSPSQKSRVSIEPVRSPLSPIRQSRQQSIFTQSIPSLLRKFMPNPYQQTN